MPPKKNSTAETSAYTLPSSTRIEVALDEAGRGALIHDVVAAAVIMPSTFNENDAMYLKIRDSKKCTPKQRQALREYIERTAIAFGIGSASAEEIDEHNILQATYIAMHRALQKVWQSVHFEHIYVDGNGFRAWMPPRTDIHSRDEGEDRVWIDFTCIPKGDASRVDIAAASILAKTYRDEQILNLIEDCPDLDHKYGLKSNKGYGTAKHMAGIKKYGLTEYHRKTFTTPKVETKDTD